MWGAPARRWMKLFVPYLRKTNDFYRPPTVLGINAILPLVDALLLLLVLLFVFCSAPLFALCELQDCRSRPTFILIGCWKTWLNQVCWTFYFCVFVCGQLFVYFDISYMSCSVVSFVWLRWWLACVHSFARNLEVVLLLREFWLIDWLIHLTKWRFVCRVRHKMSSYSYKWCFRS